MSAFKVVVLIGGNGSNLQALIDAKQSNHLSVDIAAVISHRPKAYGLIRAHNAGILNLTLDHLQYNHRTEFEADLLSTLRHYQPQVIVLAGFMRILSPFFMQHCPCPMINIHPSLLPKYPGLNTHLRALQAKDSVHGCTVHYVTEALDGGPIIAQLPVPICPDDTPSDLQARVLKAEHRLYPTVLQWLAQARIVYTPPDIWLDDQKLSAQGVQLPTLDLTTE